MPKRRLPLNNSTAEPEKSDVQPLSLQRILTATAETAEQTGFAGISMRVIAQRLGVSATALYRHVSDKNDLLDQLAEKLVREVPQLEPGQPWDRRLRHFILGLQTTFLRYPGLNRHLVTRSDRPGGQIWIETLLGILIDAGLDDSGIYEAFEQFVYFINPLTLLDFTPSAPDSLGRNMQAAIKQLRREHPALVRHLTRQPPMPSLESYAKALDRLIAAIAVKLPQAAR